MLRVLFAVLVTVMTGACATDAPPDDGIQCDSGEGPGDYVVNYDVFNAHDLSCQRISTRWYCTGECCHVMPIQRSALPIACAGMCVGLDEASCTTNAACYVARDRDEFAAGTDSFIGCYPKNGYVTSQTCATRDGDNCAYDGTCAGLYTQTPTSATFVGCVAKTATMP